MNRATKILGVGLLTAGLGAMGCGSSSSGTDAGTSDVPQTGSDVPQTGGMTYDYVISALSLDMDQMPNGTRGMAGFNLDGRYSPVRMRDLVDQDCNHGDFFSTLDPDQNMAGGACAAGTASGGTACHGGVDNQLPSIVTTINGLLMNRFDVPALLGEQISGGSLNIILRIEGVNGTLGPNLNDPSVTLRVYPFAHPTFTNCANIGMPGQMYAIDNRSLNTPNDLSSAKLTYQGSIVNGRLQVTPPMGMNAMPNFSIPLPPIMGANLQLDLYNTQMRFSLESADTGSGGNLGGFILLRDLSRAISMFQGLPIDPTTIQNILTGFVDVATPVGGATASCGGPGSDQGGIGVGLGFVSKRVVLAPMSVAAAADGTCGASGSTGDAGVADAGR